MGFCLGGSGDTWGVGGTPCGTKSLSKIELEGGGSFIFWDVHPLLRFMSSRILRSPLIAYDVSH